ncbi:MAG: Stp1/IreP family PP2C-type Ser/Thr phosphatase [Bacteroidia bacterium]|nr:Stp1/IreP family PP2C-type Ser/Thr phosphatase [Bacteroidia bacterium]
MLKTPLSLNIVTSTDKGIERENNEDYHIFCPDLSLKKWFFFDKQSVKTKMGSLLAVADGMGGEKAGEIASKLAIECIRNFISTHFDPIKVHNENDIKDLLRNAIYSGHNEIVSYQKINPETDGMGTTIVIAWLFLNRVNIAWCGDSRCYCYNESTGLRKLSKDHSYVQQLVDDKKITEEQAFYHPDSNIITQNLGSKKHPPQPDFLSYNLVKNDRLLLCSDGLNNMLTDNVIKNILHNNQDIEKCSSALIQEANDAGGHDNITIILCDVLEVKSDDKLEERLSFVKKYVKKRTISIAASCIIFLIGISLIFFYKPFRHHEKIQDGVTENFIDTIMTPQTFKVEGSKEQKNTISGDSSSLTELKINLIAIKSIFMKIKQNNIGQNSQKFLTQLQKIKKIIENQSISIKDKCDSICKELDKLSELRNNLNIHSPPPDFIKSFDKVRLYQIENCKSSSKPVKSEIETTKQDDNLRKIPPKKFIDSSSNKWGFMIITGDSVIPPRYEEARDFKGELAAVGLNNKWGYINSRGDTIIQFKYEDASDFKEGLAAVRLDNKWGFINSRGETIIPK